jgi:Phytanoyl-CoA dioxygenase (PhyH)
MAVPFSVPVVPNKGVTDDAGSSKSMHEYGKQCHSTGRSSTSSTVKVNAPENTAGGATTGPPANQGSTDRRRSTLLLGFIFRILLLDLPLFAMFVFCGVCTWTNYVTTEYLMPQLRSAIWDDDRAAAEITYYCRECSSLDISARMSSELVLSPGASPQDAYEHHLKHGFTIFPQVLSPPTVANLRHFVDSRNRHLHDQEKIYVIEGDNRFSFGLGTETPAVSAAMIEIATHPQLKASLEKILGPNPALIEMTAITSSYGAVDQWWHDDVIPTGSAIRYARTFGPSYSIFIQLQNTTKEMGATQVCPGSHYCSAGDRARLCEENGFHLVGTDGYWRSGDALLMNMNSWHRGSAHTDPRAQDRVMLILTFVPQPVSRAESRMMSQGISKCCLLWPLFNI